MNELTILLRREPTSGATFIVTRLDPDSLPLEHEQMHRALVEKIAGKTAHYEKLGPDENPFDRST